MANTRVFYPAHQLGIKANSDAGYTFDTVDDVVHGAQSVGMTTNFSLEPLFELGQISIYENREEIPDVEVTASKLLDGYEPMYLKATREGSFPTLAGRSTARAKVALSIFSDQADSATGTPLTAVACSGMFINSVSYTFPAEGSSTEEITLVGNNKLWAIGTSTDARPAYGQTDLRSGLGTISFLGAFTGASDSPLAVGGVSYREDFIFAATGSARDVNGAVADPNATILPFEVDGISASGTNDKTDDVYGAHITSISVSVDLSRESVNELGRKGPYTRTPNFPVQTTCEIQTLTTRGDLVSALEEGNFGSGAGCSANFRNLNDGTIRIALCEGLRVYLGAKNKLQSINYSGGDAQGGNVTVSYSYTGYNDFTVMHPQDSNPNFVTNDASRATYLRTM